MTETHPHNGQNPTPAGIAALMALTLYAAAALTPDQLEDLLTALGAFGTLLSLANAARRT